MTIFERIQEDTVAAQKAGQTDKLQTLRLVVNALKNQAKDLKKDTLEDTESIKVLQKELKKRKDSIQAYTEGGRAELAAKEEAEVKVLEPYLPAELSDQELEEMVSKVLSEQEAPHDFGKIMGAVMKQVAGQADGQRVRAVVQKIVDAQ